MINRTILVGRMTKDCDLRYTQSGKAVGNFTLAVNRPFKTNGEQQADFINCTVWDKGAENLANYMKKGSQVGVDGRIQTRNYENKEGKTVFVTEVIADSVQFLETKDQSNNQQSSQEQPKKSGSNNESGQPKGEDAFKVEGAPVEIDDSDLPF